MIEGKVIKMTYSSVLGYLNSKKLKLISILSKISSARILCARILCARINGFL